MARHVQGYEQVEMYVSVLAEKQREEISFIEDFAQRENIALSGEFSLTLMGKRLQAAKEQLLDYELDLQRYGKDVVRLVAGKPTIEEVAELDLVAIARAKNEGRIKSFKHGKEDVSVEMYGAAQDILKLNGRCEKPNLFGQYGYGGRRRSRTSSLYGRAFHHPRQPLGAQIASRVIYTNLQGY